MAAAKTDKDTIVSHPAGTEDESLLAVKTGSGGNFALMVAGAILLVLALGLLVTLGGPKGGQPWASSGPGDPAQTEQGR